jgi:hypothetical protein
MLRVLRRTIEPSPASIDADASERNVSAIDGSFDVANRHAPFPTDFASVTGSLGPATANSTSACTSWP